MQILEVLGVNFSGMRILTCNYNNEHNRMAACMFLLLAFLVKINLSIRLAMQELTECSGLLEGPEEHMVFTHNLKLLEDNKYFLAGRLVGMSIIHGGPGLGCLDPLLYKLMCGLQCNLTDFDINVITDSEIAETLRQVCLL